MCGPGAGHGAPPAFEPSLRLRVTLMLSQAVNLAEHHNAAVGTADPAGAFAAACTNESLWNVRGCHSKGYIGLAALRGEVLGR